MNMIDHLPSLFFGGLWVILGACGIVLLIRRRRTYLAIPQWPHTQGRVTSSSFMETWEAGHTYTPIIKYTYEVDGTTYEGDAYTFVEMRTEKKIAAEIVDALPQGLPVKVYYDPSKPSRAVLLPKNDPQTGVFSFLLATVTVLTLAGIFIAVSRCFH
jgi:hypothetical protein